MNVLFKTFPSCLSICFPLLHLSHRLLSYNKINNCLVDHVDFGVYSSSFWPYWRVPSKSQVPLWFFNMLFFVRGFLTMSIESINIFWPSLESLLVSLLTFCDILDDPIKIPLKKFYPPYVHNAHGTRWSDFSYNLILNYFLVSISFEIHPGYR